MIKGFFGRISGLDELARRYTATRTPQGEELTRQTVQIGSVSYKRCVTLRIDAEGLFLQIRFIFSKKRAPFFIPWQEIKHVQLTRLYWQQAFMLTIGNPAVTRIILPKSSYLRIAPYLPLIPS